MYEDRDRQRPRHASGQGSGQVAALAAISVASASHQPIVQRCELCQVHALGCSGPSRLLHHWAQVSHPVIPPAVPACRLALSTTGSSSSTWPGPCTGRRCRSRSSSKPSSSACQCTPCIHMQPSSSALHRILALHRPTSATSSCRHSDVAQAALAAAAWGAAQGQQEPRLSGGGPSGQGRPPSTIASDGPATGRGEPQ